MIAVSPSFPVWQSVEQNGVPVMKANITHVLEPLTNFSVGAEPPRFRPAYLQTTTRDLKLPKGFLYGVSTSATQVEGAVKEGGRGPRYVSKVKNHPLDVFLKPLSPLKLVIGTGYAISLVECL